MFAENIGWIELSGQMNEFNDLGCNCFSYAMVCKGVVSFLQDSMVGDATLRD